MVDEWMEKNFPQVYLEWECVDWGDQFNTQMKSRIAAGEIPDIMIGKAQDVQIYARTGNLAKISDAYLGKIKKDALKEVTVNGAVYGIPYNAWYQGVIYNKDILKKQTDTAHDKRRVRRYCCESGEKGIVPFASHFQESWEAANMTMQYMMNEILVKFRIGEISFVREIKIMRATQRYEIVLKITSLF